MCDDLLSRHLSLIHPSTIPLSNNPTWFTTQTGHSRTPSRSYLFLSPSYSISLDPISLPTSSNAAHSQSTANAPSSTLTPTVFPYLHSLLSLQPLWSIYSFSDTVLSLYPKHATHVSILLELVNSYPPPSHLQSLHLQHRNITFALSGLPDNFADSYEIVQDTEWFRENYPEKASCLSNEKVLSVIDLAHWNGNEQQRRRAGYLLLLPASGSLYISEINIMPEYHGKGLQLFSPTGKNLVRLLLSAILDAAQEIVSTNGHVEIWSCIDLEENKELLEVFFELGWKVNRKLWLVERNVPKADDENKEEEEKRIGLAGFGPGETRNAGKTEEEGKVDLGDWGKGMKGWADQWVRALEDIK